MTVSLTRNQALTVPLLTTYGTALLLSRDGQEVKVPLAPLLAASHLVRSMVTETPHLHPGIHGPLILSFEVASDILVGAGEILATGESNLKEEDIIPLAPLLAASHLVRSMVTETPHLHPGIHGPLILSFEVASDILVGAGEILATGESNLKEEDIEDVKQVLEMLRVEANLSYDLKNEYCENVTANIEYVKLEVEKTLMEKTLMEKL